MMELGQTSTNTANILQPDPDKKQMMNGSMRSNDQIEYLNAKATHMLAMHQTNAEVMDFSKMSATGMNSLLMQPSQISQQIPQYMMQPMQQIMQMQQISNATSQSGSMALQTLYPQLSAHNAQQGQPAQGLLNEVINDMGSGKNTAESGQSQGLNLKNYRDASVFADPPVTRGRNCGGVTEPFPEKLHTMLKYVEKENLTDIVSFLPHGRAFAVHIPKRFVTEVMPIFFRQTRITSFQRQLNLYGFQRICQGPDSGAYYHEVFLRGRPGLVANMRRTKVKGTMKVKRDPNSDPDFYAMPPVVGDNQCSTFPPTKQDQHQILEQKQKLACFKDLSQKNAQYNSINAVGGNLSINQVQQGMASPPSPQMMPLQQKLHLQSLSQKPSSALSGQQLLSMQAHQQPTQTQLQQMAMQPASLLPKVLAHPGMLNSMQFSQQQQSQVMLPMQLNASVQHAPMLLYAARQPQQQQQRSISQPGLGVFPNIYQQQQHQQNQQLQLVQSQFGMIPQNVSNNPNSKLQNISFAVNQEQQQQKQHRDILQLPNQVPLNSNRNPIFSHPKFQAQGFDSNTATETAV